MAQPHSIPAAAPAIVETSDGPRAVFTALFVPAVPNTVPAHLVVYGMSGNEDPNVDGGDYAIGLLVHRPAGDILTDGDYDLSYREAIGIMFRRAERLL